MFRIFVFSAMVLCAQNVCTCVFKLTRYCRLGTVSRRSIVPFVLLPELFSSFLACIVFMNLGTLTRIFPFLLLRIALGASISLGIASTAAFTILFFDIYHDTLGHQREQYRRVVRSSSLVIFVLVLFDVINAIVSVYFDEYFRASILGIVLLIYLGIVLVCFLLYGRRLTSAMLSYQTPNVSNCPSHNDIVSATPNLVKSRVVETSPLPHHPPQPSRNKSSAFARRVQRIGFANVVLVVAIAVFVIWSNTNDRTWMVTVLVAHYSRLIVGSLQVHALQLQGGGTSY